MSTSAAPTAIIRAPGKQGGAVVASLLDRGAPVRAIIRNVGGADDLVKRGAEVSNADLQSIEALRRGFDEVAAVFAVRRFPPR
jgi:NAD(P)H dehydrogenase (quinone)